MSTRRSGCRPAARRRRTRSWATGCIRGRTTPPRAPTSTSCMRSPDSSIDTCAGLTTAGTPSRRSSGSSASTRRRRHSRWASPGRWRAATAYPHPETVVRPLFFGAGAVPLAGRLVQPGVDDGESVDTFTHRPTAGTRGPLSWGAGDAPNGLARDLRRDEDAGPTYTSDPLDDPLEILGVPEVVVHLEVDAPVATLSVRLSDVAPDGSVALVSAGVLNLTHRRSHSGPGAAATRRRRGGPGAAPDRRLSMAAGSPHPGRARLVAVAGPVAVAVSGHVPGASRARHAVAPRAPGDPARRRSGRRGRAGVPDRAAGPALAGRGAAGRRRRGRDGPARLAHRRGRDRRLRDGPRPRRRREHRARWPAAVRGRDAAHDGLGCRPGPRRARRPRRLSLAGAGDRPRRGADPDRDQGGLPADEYARPTST